MVRRQQQDGDSTPREAPLPACRPPLRRITAVHDSPLHPPSDASVFTRPPATDGGGFSPARLARMDAGLRRHVERGLVPGVGAPVHHRGGEQVYTIGNQAFDSNMPMRRDTLFRLASMTKPITAVGAMLLVEECKIRLDDPVDAW